MTQRKQQPRCEACGHSRSFHGNGETRCRALGCGCEVWHAPVDEPEAEEALV
jgi:hypothetical protein